MGDMDVDMDTDIGDGMEDVGHKREQGTADVGQTQDVGQGT